MSFRNSWKKFSYLKRGFFIGLLILVGAYFYIIVVLLGNPKKLCMQAGVPFGGFSDVYAAPCSLAEYLLQNLLIITISLGWLIVLIVAIPAILGYILGRFRRG